MITVLIAAAAFGFGFLVGNRSAKGEGAALVAAAKAEAAKIAADVKPKA